ncbi:hypothetical protein [Natranaeroarchaeum sulfidigenes]|uniref:RNA ligase domain-containing protein n=1 Tax=Natranaeroarchaeum sulfidigenes TaxID=2784880 RepID=A0A897MW62_9EURY|nr:hypothetical protein [Natranaeroarchaeum sulfidigenes]QSG03333.1 Uncharacterized protein AArcS_2135 [Natranaeroarchaeum sulfidigenes]
MHPYLSIPSLDSAADELLEDGHLWIQELIDGDLLRFRIDSSGGLQFGDQSRVLSPDDIPLEYRYATQFVERSLDYEAALSADLDGVVFYSVATYQRTVPYDWDRMPPVLGIDVWDGERFLPPDAVEQAFERLDLDPVNAFAKEIRATDFDPESYTVPGSNWYDGQAYGVVLRSKTGKRAAIQAEQFREPEETPPTTADPAEVVDEFATPGRLERAATTLSEQGDAPESDALFDYLFDRLLRQEHQSLVEEGVHLGSVRARLSERINDSITD